MHAVVPFCLLEFRCGPEYGKQELNTGRSIKGVSSFLAHIIIVNN